MTICKFYANGYCKFGDRCRFQHVNPDHSYRNLNLQQNVTKGTSQTFSFNRALEQINHNQPQQSQSNFSFGNVASKSGSSFSFFGNHSNQPQASYNNAVSSFSFKQALQHVSQNSPQLPVVREAQMEDVEFTSTPIKSQSSFFGNTGQAVSSSQINSGFSFPSNNTNSGFGNTRPSFFAQTTNNISSAPMHSNETKSFFAPNTNFSKEPDIKNEPASLKNSVVYSQLSSLSDEDRIKFEANEFSSIIPLCPPPYELCF